LAAVQTETGVAGVEEHCFHPMRKWRFDLAWPSVKVAFEREGMAPRGGKSRHTTFTGFQGDCEKYNEAALHGWFVIRGTGKMIQSGGVVTILINLINKVSGRTTTREGEK
jgi:hypothetical protein